MRAALGHPLRRHRLVTGAVAGAIALAFVVLAVVSIVADGSSAPDGAPGGGPGAADAGADAAVLAVERAGLARFEEALEAVVQDGGFAVVHGMRPGVADIAEGAFDDEQLVTMASGWLATMERVRDQWAEWTEAEVEVASFLAEVADLYDEALARYVEVARLLLAAAESSGLERDALIEEVPALGGAADEAWERAQAELDHHRDRLGVGGGDVDVNRDGNVEDG